MVEMKARLGATRELVARYDGTGCEQLAQYLAQTASLRGDGPQGWAYPSYEHLALQRGRSFTTKPLPEGIPRGLPKHCYDNARAAAAVEPERFAYCEGWASPGSGIPVRHAWVVDLEDGIALEPTWREGLGRGGQPMYIGLVIQLDHMLDALDRSGTVLDDYMADHPILRGAVPEATWLHPAHSPDAGPGTPGPGR